MKEHVNVPGFPESVRFTDKMYDALADKKLATAAVDLNLLVEGDEEKLKEIAKAVAKQNEEYGLSVDEMNVVFQYLRDVPENQPAIEVES